MENVQSTYSLKHHNIKADAKPCYQHFQIAPASQHTCMTVIKSPIHLQDANVPLEIQHKLNTMLTNKFAEIFSKSPADFGWTNLIEMDLPTTGPPVSTKPYTIPLKYKSFIDDEIKLLKDASCISKSLSNWASLICIMKKKPDLESTRQAPTSHVLTIEKSINP